VLFADQVGVRSDHLSGRTWGRKGQTPTVARCWPSLSLPMLASSVVPMTRVWERPRSAG
jgi:hypothetical protein